MPTETDPAPTADMADALSSISVSSAVTPDLLTPPDANGSKEVPSLPDTSSDVSAPRPEVSDQMEAWFLDAASGTDTESPPELSGTTDPVESFVMPSPVVGPPEPDVI